MRLVDWVGGQWTGCLSFVLQIRPLKTTWSPFISSLHEWASRYLMSNNSCQLFCRFFGSQICKCHFSYISATTMLMISLLYTGLTVCYGSQLSIHVACILLCLVPRASTKIKEERRVWQHPQTTDQNGQWGARLSNSNILIPMPWWGGLGMRLASQCLHHPEKDLVIANYSLCPQLFLFLYTYIL